MRHIYFQRLLTILGCMMILAIALAVTKPAEAGGVANTGNNNSSRSTIENVTSTANNAGQHNTQTVTGGSLDTQQSITVESQRQVPGLGMGISGDCIGAGLQLAVPIFGVTTTAADEDCRKLRAAYFARAMGDDKLARELLMATDAVKSLDRPSPAIVPTGWDNWGD